MANQKISDRTLASSLTGTEKIPIGVTGNKATTPYQLKAYVDAPTTLDDLTDVTISAPQTYHTLRYSGGSWFNNTNSRRRVTVAGTTDFYDSVTDDDAIIELTNASPITVTLTNVLANNQSSTIYVKKGGDVSFVAGDSATIEGATSLTTANGAVYCYFNSATLVFTVIDISGGGGGGTWGSITGTLSSQTDLQAELTRIENLIGNSELGTGL